MKQNYNILHYFLGGATKDHKMIYHKKCFVQKLKKLYLNRVEQERGIITRYPLLGMELYPPNTYPTASNGSGDNDDIKINILYYFKVDNARLFQYYEEQIFILDHLARTCTRKFYYLLNIHLDRGMRMVQMEDLKRERQRNRRRKIHTTLCI